MGFYFRYTINVFQQNSIYRTRFILQLFYSILNLLVYISIWTALYSTSKFSNPQTLNLNEMINYVVVSTIISSIVSNNIIYMIDNKIKTGDIAIDLIRPIDFSTLLLCETIGRNLYQTIIISVPIIIISSFFFEFSPPNPTYLGLFIFSLLLAFIINFCLMFLFGMLGFWYLTIWHLDQFLNDIIKLFAGVWIPLWLFPGFLSDFANYLPFRLIYFSPITIFLEKVTIEEILFIYMQQLITVVFLVLLIALTWRKGIRKIVIQGG